MNPVFFSSAIILKCGRKSIPANSLILEGKNGGKSEYPWQAGIYRVQNTTKSLICSGSLLNQRVILTAAHCISDLSGNVFPKESFIVAVGKYYRKFDDPRDDNAQFSPIKNIFVPGQYRGETQNYYGDIALLVTENKFEFSRQVQPVCIDWTAKLDIKPATNGYITGWGFKEENQAPSEELKALKVPYIDKQRCSSSTPLEYQIFLTEDKFCSGFQTPGKKVCQGGGGGGIIFKNDGRYYVEGVLSLSLQAGCESKIAMYTRVSKYLKNFILEKFLMYS